MSAVILSIELGAGDLALLEAIVPDPIKRAEWCVKQIRGALNRQPQTMLVREFEDFWNVYPRKEGKGAARTAYVRARQKVDAGSILRGLAAYSIARRDSERKFIAMPSTWLNQERWSDELTPQTEPPKTDPHYAARKKIEHFLQTGRWIWGGIPPTDKYTLYPKELLREFEVKFKAKGLEIPALVS